MNKMNFHPQKCKVVSVAHRPPPLMGILPNIQYFYTLGDSPLDYAEGEKDLGVDINIKLNFNDQCNRLLAKATQQIALTKTTCYFVNDIRRKRALYLSLIRSQFEHCSPIWRPRRVVKLCSIYLKVYKKAVSSGFSQKTILYIILIVRTYKNVDKLIFCH